MLNIPSLDCCFEVLHGEFYSVFCDESRNYWVLNNNFPCVYQGPFSFELACKIMVSANEYYNSIKLKGSSVL